MAEIIYLLGALNQFYNSAHWRSRGALFKEMHDLFADLYAGISGEIDELVELSIGNGLGDEFVEPQLFAEKVRSVLPKGSTSNNKNLAEALSLEEKLVASIKGVNQNEVGVGLYDNLTEISRNHEKSIYKLRQTLKGI